MNYSFFEESTDCSNEPISDGFRVVRIPQASITANLPSAVPVPPEMIAPACPILFPAGAVTPAIKPTTGFFILFFYPFGSSFFVASADFSDHDDRIGFRIIVKELEHIDMF